MIQQRNVSAQTFSTKITYQSKNHVSLRIRHPTGGSVRRRIEPPLLGCTDQTLWRGGCCAHVGGDVTRCCNMHVITTTKTVCAASHNVSAVCEATAGDARWCVCVVVGVREKQEPSLAFINPTHLTHAHTHTGQHAAARHVDPLARDRMRAQCNRTFFKRDSLER